MSKTLAVAVLSMLVGHACGLRMILSDASNATGEDPAMLFEEFQNKYNKVYPDDAEREYRFGVFTDNLQLVKQINERGGANHRVNKFSDMTSSEFSSRILMRKQAFSSVPKQGSVPMNGSVADIPESWNWYDQGAVTRVKDQGAFGTCWAFSAVGNIEGQLAIKEGKLVDLSVEQISDCDSLSYESKNIAACGMFGGDPTLAFEYLMDAGGIQLWDDYPYCMGDGTCSPCTAQGYNEYTCGPQPLTCNIEDSCHFDKSKAVTQLKDWASLSQDEDELAVQLYQNGPVSIVVDGGVLTSYSDGVLNGDYCSSDPDDGNHAVLLVGYGSGTVEDTGEEIKYWIVKNSWGEDWGQDGYFYIRRGINACGIANSPTTAVL